MSRDDDEAYADARRLYCRVFNKRGDAASDDALASEFDHLSIADRNRWIYARRDLFAAWCVRHDRRRAE